MNNFEVNNTKIDALTKTIKNQTLSLMRDHAKVSPNDNYPGLLEEILLGFLGDIYTKGFDYNKKF